MYTDTDTDVSMLTGDKWCEMIHACFESQLYGQKIGRVGHNTIPALIGPPGIGKTQKLTTKYVEWLKENGSEVLEIDNPSVHLHTVILSQSDSVDIGGAYAPDFDKGTLRHLVIKDILGHIENVDADIIIILFDELGNANAAMLAAIQSLFEDGMIRGHKKAANCVYAVATNRPQDGTNSIKLPRSLVEGRLVSIHMGVNHEEWLEWAQEQGIHAKIWAPIHWRPSLLYKFDPKAKGVNPTPRGYEKASRLIDRMREVDMDILDTLIPGCIGDGVYAELRGYWEHAESLPLYEEILSDPDTAPVPGGGDCVGEGPSGQYAISTNICYELQEIKKRDEFLSRKDATAIITYINRLDDEIGMFAMRICGDAHDNLKDCEAYAQFMEKNKDYTIRQS